MRKGAVLLAVALGLMAAAAGLFLARPGLFLTSRVVGEGLRRLGASYAPRWKTLQFAATAREPRRHRYHFRSTGLCFSDPGGVYSTCFSELELSVIVFYSGRGPVVERVDRLAATVETASVDLRRRLPRVAAFIVPRALRSTSVEELRVEVSSFTVHADSASVSGKFAAALALEGRRPLSASADLRIRGPKGTERLKAELTADTDLLEGGKPSFVDLVGRAELGKLGRARVAVRARRDLARYFVSGGASLDAASGPLRAVRLTGCEGSAPFAAGGGRPAGGDGACRFEVIPRRDPEGPLGRMTRASGRISVRGGVGGERWNAGLAASLDPVAAWGSLAAELKAAAEGSLDRPLGEAAVSHELRASAALPRFEQLADFLRDTSWAVPAPIHVLTGPLSASISSRGDSRAERVAFSYELSSRLTGKRQRLVAGAKGVLTAVDALSPGRSFEHEGTLTLDEVALELPRLDVGRAPKVSSDKRIKAPPRSPTASRRPLPPVRGTLGVRTVKPLILFSNLAKDPVPIALDLTAFFPPSGVHGLVSVKRFGVELFRRDAVIDHLDVRLSSGSRVGELEGLVLYKAPGTAISIRIHGTTEKPRVEFTSVPPLKREEIIALLIFGKSPDELDPEQSASVSNTESALQSRAFGLASLYLFGATPIEHVGYDAATKTTSVRLRLPGGANLTLGGDFDQSKQLSVRKALAPHWAIQSEVTGQGGESSAAATFLEWFNRY